MVPTAPPTIKPAVNEPRVPNAKSAASAKAEDQGRGPPSPHELRLPAEAKVEAPAPPNPVHVGSAVVSIPASQAYSPFRTQAVVALTQKSVGVAIILSVLFGPLGMFYSTIFGALVMVVINIAAAVLTFGLGLCITWPVCILWAAVAAHVHNQRLLRRAA